MTLLRALALWCLLALPVMAQGLPEPLSGYVSDFADVLDEAAKERLTERLEALRADPGVEVAVVTIHRRADYGSHPDIESFAKALFNHWGIGDATVHDGVLILLAVEDREARIALGAGYPPVWDGRALRVMDIFMVPRFAEGDHAGGLEAGLHGLETWLIRPFKEGVSYEDSPDPPGVWGGKGWWDFAAIVGFITAGLAMIGWDARHRLGDLLAVRRPCPSCGGRGIVIEKDPLPETRDAAPERHIRRICPQCGWHQDRSEPVPVAHDDSRGGGGGFGGGQSSGGGASGRW